ncbi:hypothetical protein Cenrod_1926 [Candidatus Symbiobacter mobilis CR]|uniref:Porin n=2 Tax=Candidatus Symbiobacter TaxID=1436289 RepID=U5NCW0_9BURK|nr:hypothetical protein Cenrod_1926 [Candidatus Symbiobacter mobilis CR]
MAAVLGTFALTAFAEPDSLPAESSRLQISGYLSLVGGRVWDGVPDVYGTAQMLDATCPCYIADWGNAGVYGRDFSITPESRIGLQGTYTLTDTASVTAQIVSRGTDERPTLTWAYASVKLSDAFEVQAGRKRIPLYYYSDFQDIGLSYPWITPPPELYGWEATNYNGASVRYEGNVQGTDVRASLFAGQEKVDDSLYYELLGYMDGYQGPTTVKWKNLVGADAEFSRGPLVARLVTMQSDIHIDNTADPDDPWEEQQRLRAHGIAVNLDFDSWFVLSEFTKLTRDYPQDGYTVSAPAKTIGAGYRWGAWTPFLNYAKFTEESSDIELYPPTGYKRTSLTLRYDLRPGNAIKVQWDKNTDITKNYGGDGKVLRIAYDLVF